MFGVSTTQIPTLDHHAHHELRSTRGVLLSFLAHLSSLGRQSCAFLMSLWPLQVVSREF